jgi:hypothetical protein
MKHWFKIGVALGLVLACAHQTCAQAATPAPNYLQIFREEVKVGHAPAHAKTEMGWPRAFAKHNWPTHYIAMTSITGPAEAWYVTPWQSLADWERDTAAIAGNAALQAEMDRLSGEDAQHLTNGRSLVARYRADLSHRPGVNIPQQRYLSISIVRIRPGRNEDFEASRKISVDAHVKAGVNDNHSVYQVISGMPAGTFLIVTPMKSLAEVDASPQVHGQAFQDAIGDAGRKKLSELAGSGTIGAETMYFAFSPEMSYPPKEYMDADPGFWKPKAKAAPARKEAPPAKP